MQETPLAPRTISTNGSGVLSLMAACRFRQRGRFLRLLHLSRLSHLSRAFFPWCSGCLAVVSGGGAGVGAAGGGGPGGGCGVGVGCVCCVGVVWVSVGVGDGEGFFGEVASGAEALGVFDGCGAALGVAVDVVDGGNGCVAVGAAAGAVPESNEFSECFGWGYPQIVDT